MTPQNHYLLVTLAGVFLLTNFLGLSFTLLRRNPKLYWLLQEEVRWLFRHKRAK